MNFEGIHTALITPFSEGVIDFKSLELILDKQIQAGVASVVVCGSTGEGYSLSIDERLEMFDFCVRKVAGKIKVIASVGTHNTKESILIAQKSQMLGIDGMMLVTPYYNKPPQEGLYEHFERIHNATQLPIMLYNIPGRSGIDMQDQTIARLSKLERVVALKDATATLSRPFILREIYKSDIVQLTGDDITSLPFYASGGRGLVSVISNIFPKEFVEIYNLWKASRTPEAQAMHNRFIPLLVALNSTTNPIAIKYAASCFGMCMDEVRLPLVVAHRDIKEQIKMELDKLV
jgi:4-hydroxy-tetrahydrodipicolinate synthase